jgi:polysaccharide biosynthesis transport protein
VATMTDNSEDEDGGGSFLVHLPVIAWQRKWWLIIPTLIMAIAGSAAAYLLPTTYRSTATLLVESSQLPEEVAGTPTTDVIDQRLAKVRQQVLSRPDLIEMIQRLDLYIKDRASKPLSEVIETLRENVRFAPVTSEIQQRGGSRSATIAFTMSFDYPDAIKAQAVAQNVTDRILRIDSTKNAEQAANTVQFLTDQSAGLQTQISLLEQQISGLKSRNGRALSSAGVTMLGAAGGGNDAQIAALQRDNAQLNAQRDMTKTAATRDPIVAQAEAQLAAARAVYTETHPDVILAKQRLAEAKELAVRTVGNLPIDTIASQIAFNNSQIAALMSARARESAQSSAILNAQSRAPLVLEQAAQLQQKLEGLNVQYQQVSGKLLTAQAASKMENEQKGERLMVIDPPVVPDKPASPNRPLLIFGGLAAGLGLGLLCALGLELLLSPIRGVGAVKAITGFAPLVAIPTIEPKSFKSGKRWYARLWPFGRSRAAAAD